MACDLPTAGEVICDEAVVDRTVVVRQYDPALAEPSGWLHIRANVITITADGALDATGKGYRTEQVGAVWGNGGGPGGGVRGTQASVGTPAPGGGGGHVGMGGLGIGDLAGCLTFPSAAGGARYDNPLIPVALVDPLAGMGSAGGASFCGDSGDQVRPGARGGGVVLLSAALVRIEGAVRADGEGLDELGGNFGGCGPGAGAGGSIVIFAPSLEIGATAQLSVRGGRGLETLDARAMDASNSWGGGGGGGLIAVFTDSDITAMAEDVLGGAAACIGGRGEAGEFVVSAPGGCIDADGDGRGSSACGGPDCDDGATDVHPGAEEICDGIDNQCDGQVDEAAPALCPAGSGKICRDGACVDDPGGIGGSPTPGIPEVELGGGLCAVAAGAAPRPPNHGARGLGAAWMALAVAWALRGRPHRR